MKHAILLLAFLAMASCRQHRSETIADDEQKSYDFVIGFGSCNNQHMQNTLWEPISLHEPDLFVWGGDIVYSDTEDMDRMRDAYALVKSNPDYKKFAAGRQIMGTWDDHDYGLNDGGAEYPMKDSVQQILLDFLDVKENDSRRQRKGVYHSREFEVGNKTIKVILLDTRFFRTALKKDPIRKKRYLPLEDPEATMLGDRQWEWLRSQLQGSQADFHVIVSSIQLLSPYHGFETWANMPGEVNRFLNLLTETQPKGLIVLSGDRHIAELSSLEVDGLAYPLVDFTASGMTHSYTSFKGEENPYRISQVVAEKNFGLVQFDFENNALSLEIRGEENALYVRHLLKFPK